MKANGQVRFWEKSTFTPELVRNVCSDERGTSYSGSKALLVTSAAQYRGDGPEDNG